MSSERPLDQDPARPAAGVRFGQPIIRIDTTAAAEMPLPRRWAERFAQLVPVSICFLDRNLVFTWMNPEAQRLTERYFKVPGGSLLGMNFRVGTAQTHAEQAAEEALQSGKVVEFNTSYTTDDGLQSYWRLTFCPVAGDDQDIEGVLMVSEDITQQVENERRDQEQIEHLLALDRLKTDFLNASSHELRTPLTTILGFSEFLVDETHGPLNREQHGHVEQILSATYRLERIVADLLDYSRIEGGTFGLIRREADLGLVVESALESMRPQTREAGVELWLERPEDPLEFDLDPERVTQIVQNLLGNALKFTGSGGRVDVRVAVNGSRVRVEVQDSGVGIAPDDLPKIFDRFYQGKQAPKQANRGAGLGLFITRALVKAHGGDIGADSELGHGSTFWFTLPLR